MEDPQRKPVFFPALEGLRGVAIIAVIIYHNFPYGNTLFGWLGVDLFFVLSGFLITGILLDTFKQSPPGQGLRNFFIRRILRIFPLYYMVLLLLLVVFPAIGWFNAEVKEYQQDFPWFIFYLQNWLFAIDFPETSHCLNHFWSLAVEEQYYIFWPVLILLLKKPARLLVFLSCFLIGLFAFRSFLWYQHLSDFNYTTFYIFTRFDGICIGSIVAVLVSYKKDFLKKYTALIISVLAVLNFLFYFLNTSGDLPYLAFIGYTTFSAMFGILVYELTYGNTRIIKQAFSFSLLRHLGRISYGLYIFHWPVHYFAAPLLNEFFQDIASTPNISLLLTAIITSFVSIGLSWMSYHFFEKKFLVIKDRFR